MLRIEMNPAGMSVSELSATGAFLIALANARPQDIRGKTETLSISVNVDTAQASAALDELKTKADGVTESVAKLSPDQRSVIIQDAAIAPADRPDAGAESASSLATVPTPPASPFAAFAGLPVAAALPNVALSTAAVAPSSTAPVVTPATSTPAPSALTPPVQAAPPAGVLVVAPMTGVPLDSEGLPWDKRIHAGTRSKIGPGTWKLARGIDPTLVETVKAELRAVMAIPASGAAPVAVVTPPALQPSAAWPFPIPGAAAASPPVDQPIVITQVTGTVAQEIPLVPAAATAPAVPNVPAVAPSISPPPGQGTPASPNTFPELMQTIMPIIAAQKLTMGQVVEACNENGVPSLQMVAPRPDLLPAVFASIMKRVLP